MPGGSRCTAWMLACLASACQGDYPIAPTACDEWCYVTESWECGKNYQRDPAVCVATCERQGITANPECSAELTAVLECFRGLSESEKSCGHGEILCRVQLDAFTRCRFAPPPAPSGAQNAPSAPRLGTVTGPIAS